MVIHHMTRYVKRRIIIEAAQWTGDNIEELWEWVGAGVLYAPIPANGAIGAEPARLYVAANDAWLDLDVGEWIIKDSLGFYPCKDRIFATNYEKA